MDRLPAEIESVLRAHLGPLARAEDVSWEHRQAEVWRVETEAGREVFAKRHARKEKLVREALAYETWIPFIAEHAPELIAVDREDRGLLVLGSAGGQMAKNVELSPLEERALYRLAGSVLAEFHAITLKTAAEHELAITPDQVLEKERAGFEHWSRASKELLDATMFDWIKGYFAELGPPFPPVVICHGDYSMRNWLVERRPSGLALCVIDFERAGPNFAPIDLRLLCLRAFSRRRDLHEAFSEGYGCDLVSRHADFYRRQLSYYAMSTVSWARQKGDLVFEAEGRSLLESLRRGDALC